MFSIVTPRLLHRTSLFCQENNAPLTSCLSVEGKKGKHQNNRRAVRTGGIYASCSQQGQFKGNLISDARICLQWPIGLHFLYVILFFWGGLMVF